MCKTKGKKKEETKLMVLAQPQISITVYQNTMSILFSAKVAKNHSYDLFMLECQHYGIITIITQFSE